MRNGPIRRRDFVALLGGAAVGGPVGASAQKSATPIVGLLHASVAGPYVPMVSELREGLKIMGFVDGQNVAFEYRWANNQVERLPALAADLVHRQVAVIVAAGGEHPALAAKAATSTIPIVLAIGADPVKLGLVASLNRPGGNITGITFLTAELGPKRLDLLCKLLPQATTVGYLSTKPQSSITREDEASQIIAAAQALGRQVLVLVAISDRDFEAAFETLIQHHAGALVVATNPFFTSNRDKLLALAARYKIPTIYHVREFVLDGGLISYGANISSVFRQAGIYVGQILKGAKPAELPVQQSTHFDLVINLKTAKALGIDVPAWLLVAADEVIQ